MSEDGTGSTMNVRSVIIKAVPVVIVVAILISTTVFFFNLNGGSFDYSKSDILIVPTGSMDGDPQDYPISTIPKDSVIMIHVLSDDQKADLEVGDVVTFYQGGIYKVHRIKEIDGDTIITKGDANQLPDAPIKSSDVVGIVVGVAPAMGKIVTFVRNSFVSSPLFIIIGIVILTVMIYSIIEVINIVRHGDEEEEG